MNNKDRIVIFIDGSNHYHIIKDMFKDKVSLNDFVPAVQAVKEVGKNVENIGFETKFSYHLKQECDGFRKLNKKFIGSCFN